jgi:hypothetical protein
MWGARPWDEAPTAGAQHGVPAYAGGQERGVF